MTKEEVKHKIIEGKVISVVRMKNPSQLINVIKALKEGGIKAVELTMTIPNAIEAIRNANEEFGESILLGVGSIIDPETSNDAIDAGAKFVVSPIYKKEVVQAVRERNKVVIPGGFTPTEIQSAYQQGADFVKIFPADNLGMSFIKSIKAPLPHLKVIPTGGVDLENAKDWINYGASAVGIGSALVDNKAIENNDYNKLTENARKLCLNLGLQ